jgi:hypothetical protein
MAADRLSCPAYRANAFRLQLDALAYNLLVLLRSLLLHGTQLACASLVQVRLRLFKLGSRVHRSVRRQWFHLARGWPARPLFAVLLARLGTIRAPT